LKAPDAPVFGLGTWSAVRSLMRTLAALFVLLALPLACAQHGAPEVVPPTSRLRAYGSPTDDGPKPVLDQLADRVFTGSPKDTRPPARRELATFR
jgi:hypothetical protein